MSIILAILAILFFLKIGWNILTPYVLGLQAIKTGNVSKSGVSMAPIVEVVLTLVAWLCSFYVSGPNRWISPQALIIGGITLILVSYIHLSIAAPLVGWMVRKYKKK